MRLLLNNPTWTYCCLFPTNEVATLVKALIYAVVASHMIHTWTFSSSALSFSFSFPFPVALALPYAPLRLPPLPRPFAADTCTSAASPLATTWSFVSVLMTIPRNLRSEAMSSPAVGIASILSGRQLLHSRTQVYSHVSDLQHTRLAVISTCSLVDIDKSTLAIPALR